MPNYQPEKHHFIPAFQQQPWATGNDGKVCEMKLINGEVVPKRAHPNASGYRRNLYTTAGIPADQAQYLETNFFTPLDTQASIALQRMLAMDKEPWPIELRHAWTRYVMSLMFRDPGTVSILKEHSENMWREGLAILEADYAARRRPTDPDDFANYLTLTNPAAAQIGTTNFMMRIINNDRVGPDIARMHWSVLRPIRSQFSLLLSDRPLIRPFGLDDPKAFIILPIAPDAFFLASNDPEAAKIAASRDHSWMVREINLNVVGQAVEFAWGVNDSQLSFVQKYFGKSPLPPAITAAQRERAVASTRGEIGRLSPLTTRSFRSARCAGGRRSDRVPAAGTCGRQEADVLLKARRSSACRSDTRHHAHRRFL